MWPWEHLAAGYLLFSLGLRAVGRDPPTDVAILALAVATQLPDLVDKPLSWGLGWFPTGHAIGHSAFVAVPVGLGVLHLGRRHGHSQVGAAILVGYWSHLLTDVVNPLRYGSSVSPGRVLWPVVEADPYTTNYGLGRGLVYFEALYAELSTMSLSSVILLYLLLPAAMIGLWLLDGAPGLGLAGRTVDGVRRYL